MLPEAVRRRVVDVGIVEVEWPEVVVVIKDLKVRSNEGLEVPFARVANVSQLARHVKSESTMPGPAFWLVAYANTCVSKFREMSRVGATGMRK